MRPISAEESRGYSHLTSGTSKGSFTPLLQLKKFQDIPVSTREEARESRPHPEEPRFRLLARWRDPFPACSGKNSGRFRRISRGGALHRKGERNSSVVPPFPESPRCLSPFQRTWFPCTASTYKPRIDSHHSARGAALWESLVGKPRWKSTDPLIHAKGSVTLLLKLGRKAHVHGPTRDED